MSWLRVERLRAIASALFSRGAIGAGWYAILTGAALLSGAELLASVGDSDREAPYVTPALFLLGLWQLGKGAQLLSRRTLRTPGPRGRIDNDLLVICLVMTLVGMTALAVGAFAFGAVVLTGVVVVMGTGLRAVDD